MSKLQSLIQWSCEALWLWCQTFDWRWQHKPEGWKVDALCWVRKVKWKKTWRQEWWRGKVDGVRNGAERKSSCGEMEFGPCWVCLYVYIDLADRIWEEMAIFEVLIGTKIPNVLASNTCQPDSIQRRPTSVELGGGVRTTEHHGSPCENEDYQKRRRH